MRVGCSGERNTFLHCELNDPVSWVSFVHRLAPSGGGKLNREVLRSNKVKCFTDQTTDLCTRPMTMDFDEIEMGKAIDQTRSCYFSDTTKIIGVHRVDIAAFELRRAIRHAVEHLIGAIEEMNRAEDKIEFVPMLLNPVSAGRRVNGIIVELNAGADSQIRVFFPQTIDLIEIDSGVITIVIGKSNIGQS